MTDLACIRFPIAITVRRPDSRPKPCHFVVLPRKSIVSMVITISVMTTMMRRRRPRQERGKRDLGLAEKSEKSMLLLSRQRKVESSLPLGEDAATAMDAADSPAPPVPPAFHLGGSETLLSEGPKTENWPPGLWGCASLSLNVVAAASAVTAAVVVTKAGQLLAVLPG